MNIILVYYRIPCPVPIFRLYSLAFFCPVDPVKSPKNIATFDRHLLSPRLIGTPVVPFIAPFSRVGAGHSRIFDTTNRASAGPSYHAQRDATPPRSVFLPFLPFPPLTLGLIFKIMMSLLLPQSRTRMITLPQQDPSVADTPPETVKSLSLSFSVCFFMTLSLYFEVRVKIMLRIKNYFWFLGEAASSICSFFGTTLR